MQIIYSVYSKWISACINYILPCPYLFLGIIDITSLLQYWGIWLASRVCLKHLRRSDISSGLNVLYQLVFRRETTLSSSGSVISAVSMLFYSSPIEGRSRHFKNSIITQSSALSGWGNKFFLIDFKCLLFV